MSLARLAVQLLPALGAVLPRGGPSPGVAIKGVLIEVVLWLVAGAVAATGFGFGVAACYMALAVTQGPPAAAGIVAVGLFVLAGIIVGVIATLSLRRTRRRALERLAAQQAADASVNRLMGQVTANPLRSLAMAVAAGAIAGWLDRKI